MKRPAVLALDLGGTRLKGAVVTGSDLGPVRVVDLDGADASRALDAATELGRELAGGSGCVGVGLCVPGLVDDDGRVTEVPGKLAGIVGLDLPKIMADRIGLEAVVTNDALAYAVGEARCGAGAGWSRVVVVTLGTGVGVAVCQDGVPVGSGPLRGGILGGFIPILESSPGIDTNGGRGTVEAVCRARRIVEEVREHGGDLGSVPPGSVPEVYEACRRRDPSALAGVASYREGLIRALVALANAHTPEGIVVGGGPATTDAPIFDGLRDAVSERLWSSYEIDVRPAALGDAAALVGLAQLWERA